jgi:hypothetical protein
VSRSADGQMARVALGRRMTGGASADEPARFDPAGAGCGGLVHRVHISKNRGRSSPTSASARLPRCHRGCVATSSFRFLPEERGVGRSCGVRQPVIHVILTIARHGTIRIAKSDHVNRTSLAEQIIEVLSGKAPDGAAGIERHGGNRRGRHVAFCGDGAKDRWKVQGWRNWARR